MRKEDIMRLAIMQPYFFPYIGYWQLMNAVDKFVIYDDVNYIKGGWINRNKIIENKEENYLTLPLQKSSPYKLINEINIFEPQKNKEKIYHRICVAYKKAPHYKDVIYLLKEAILNSEVNLVQYLTNTIKIVNEYLEINTILIVSSTLEKDNSKKGQEKIIEICRQLKADHYINPIGGTNLYDKKEFEKYGIKLSFLKTEDIIYKQFDNEFIPNLSIIDVMMFNSKDEINKMLDKFTLI